MRPGQAFEDRLAEGHARMSPYETVHDALNDYMPHTDDCPTQFAGRQPDCACPVGETFAALDRLNALVGPNVGHVDVSVKDVLEVRDELARMQAEIDRLQGEKDAMRDELYIRIGDRERERDFYQAENTRLQARVEELEGALERVTTCSSILTAKGLADQALAAPSRETE